MGDRTDAEAKLAVIVLAGGYSRRMGRDKAELPWQGATLLSYICRQFQNIGQAVAVVIRRGQVIAAPAGASVIEDRQADVGPLMGLATGLAYWHERGIPWSFVTTCDAPLVRPALAQQLWQLAEGAEAAVPQLQEQIYGLTGVYQTRLAAPIFELLENGVRRVRDLPHYFNCRMVSAGLLNDVDPQLLSFRNVNTADEYDALLREAAGEGVRIASDELGRASRDALQDLRQLVRQFVAERQWQRFHSPKNLSMALAIEAAELMEHFQWLSADESRAVGSDAAKCQAVAEEMSDVFCYLLALANELDVDLATALTAKMEKNRQKYPVAEIRGRFGHDDPRPAAPADDSR